VTSKGSHTTWGGWEPKVCWVCGKPVTLRQSSGHSFAEKRSWHTSCATAPSKAASAQLEASDPTREDESSRRPHASELLETPNALLLRTDLRDLGLSRRAVDAVFRACPNIVLLGFSRPMVRVEAYKAFLEGSTYCDRCGDRVRPG
jgi:hypothetical protein